MLVTLAVHVNTVYQIGCEICQMEAVDGEIYDTPGDAEDARRAHIQEHQGYE